MFIYRFINNLLLFFIGFILVIKSFSWSSQFSKCVNHFPIFMRNEAWCKSRVFSNALVIDNKYLIGRNVQRWESFFQWLFLHMWVKLQRIGSRLHQYDQQFWWWVILFWFGISLGYFICLPLQKKFINLKDFWNY